MYFGKTRQVFSYNLHYIIKFIYHFKDPKQQLKVKEVEPLFNVKGGCKQSKVDGSLLCVKKTKQVAMKEF